MSAKIHNFGAISLIYKIPFKDTLQNIRQHLMALIINGQSKVLLMLKSSIKN